MSFLAYRTGSQDDFLWLGQRLYQHSITNSAKHSSKMYCRARQRCVRLLAFISHPQVRNIHLPGRMILPGSLIPSDTYFLKNLTFVVCIFTHVATSPFQSNSLRGQGEEQQLKQQCPSWPTGWEVMTTSSDWVRGYISTPSPTVQSTPVKCTVEQDSAVSGNKPSSAALR